MPFLPEKEIAITIQDCVKEGYNYIGLVRTSTTEQSEALVQQEEYVRDAMKRIGFKKDPVLMSIQNVSGAKEQRQQIEEILQFLEGISPENRKLVVVARDIERVSRNTFQALMFQQELQRLGVYLYILNNNLLIGGTGIEQGTARMIFELLLAVASSGKFSEVKASQKGRRKAKKEKGIQGGTARDTYRENIATSGKQKDKTIFERVYASLGGLDAGTITVKGLARELSNSRRKIYPKVIRDLRDEMLKIREEAGEEKLRQWVAVWPELVKYEKRKSVGSLAKPPRPIVINGKKQKFAQTERARAIWRVAQGFINEPAKWNDPVNVGNPETATIPSANKGGTIREAFANPQDYIPFGK